MDYEQAMALAGRVRDFQRAVSALGVGQPDPQLTAPTEDQLRLARAS